jgi:hypothetical protein
MINQKNLTVYGTRLFFGTQPVPFSSSFIIIPQDTIPLPHTLYLDIHETALFATSQGIRMKR